MTRRVAPPSAPAGRYLVLLGGLGLSGCMLNPIGEDPGNNDGTTDSSGFIPGSPMAGAESPDSNSPSGTTPPNAEPAGPVTQPSTMGPLGPTGAIDPPGAGPSGASGSVPPEPVIGVGGGSAAGSPGFPSGGAAPADAGAGGAVGGTGAADVGDAGPAVGDAGPPTSLGGDGEGFDVDAP